MRVLVDTNIILDFMLKREPFAIDAEDLFRAIRYGRIVGYLTATTLADLFFIVKRETQSIEDASVAVSTTLLLMEVCRIDRLRLEAANASNLNNFEDALQLACAIADNLDAIITRNPQGFAGAILPILSVGELLESL